MNARCLGVDYGTHRVGLAISDETAMLATPLETVAVRGMDDAVRAVARHCDRMGVRRVVVGMPLNMNRTRGPSAVAAAVLAERIRRETGLKVVEWDERLTTRQAEKSLITAGVRRERRRGLIDQVAAQLILQSYLDSRNYSPCDADE